MSEQALSSREAFRAFLALIDEVDRHFLSEERRVTDPADIAEGEHMLLHLVKAAIDVWVDNDASRPRFAPLASPVLKWGGEGSDNPAHCAPLDPNRRYRLRGRMQDEVYISFTVYTGKAEIIDALHETRLREIHSASVEAEIAESNPLEALVAGSRAYLTYFVVRPDYLRMYLDEGTNWGVRRSMDRESRRAAVWNDGVAQLAAIFERGIAQGVFEPGSPDRLARTMLAMQQVLLADWFEDGMTQPEPELMDEVEVLLRRTFCTPEWRTH